MDKMKLYEHDPYPHTAVNVNDLHHLEHAKAGFNQKVAVLLTRWVGSMLCAYLFALIALIGFPGFSATPMQYVQWLSQCFIQLVMLSVIMVGQKVLGRKQELQADEQFLTTMKTYHDIEEIMSHLSAQDEELLKQTQLIQDMAQHIIEQDAKIAQLLQSKPTPRKKAEVKAVE